MEFLILLICGGSLAAESHSNFLKNMRMMCDTAEFIGRVELAHDTLKVDAATRYSIYELRVIWKDVYKHIGITAYRDELYARFDGEMKQGEIRIIGGKTEDLYVHGRHYKMVVVTPMWHDVGRVAVIEGDGAPSYKSYKEFFSRLCGLRQTLDNVECNIP